MLNAGSVAFWTSEVVLTIYFPSLTHFHEQSGAFKAFVILTDGNSHPVLSVAGVSNKLAADSSLVSKFVFDCSHLEVSLKSPIVVMASVKKVGTDV